MNNKNLIYLGIAAAILFLLNKKKDETSETTDGTTDQTFPGNPDKSSAPSNTGVVSPINN